MGAKDSTEIKFLFFFSWLWDWILERTKGMAEGRNLKKIMLSPQVGRHQLQDLVLP